MLGRFVLAPSFSRRWSSGFQMGPSRFGFCCSDRGLLNVFTISIPSIHYSHPKLPRRLLPRLSQHPEPSRSLAMFRDTYMESSSSRLDHYHLSGPVVSVG